jgi:hypothetical protein
MMWFASKLSGRNKVIYEVCARSTGLIQMMKDADIVLESFFTSWAVGHASEEAYTMYTT